MTINPHKLTRLKKKKIMSEEAREVSHYDV